MAEKPDKEVKRKDALADFKGEFRQIKWPTKRELRKQVITVIITCIIVTAGIFVMDYTISLGLDGAGRVFGIEAFDPHSMWDFSDFDDFDIDWGDIDLGDLGFDMDGVQIDIVDAEDVTADPVGE